MPDQPKYRFRAKTADGQEVISEVLHTPAWPPAAELSFTLRDGGGHEVPGLPYTIRAGQQQIKGKSGPKGQVSARLPPGTEGVELEARLPGLAHATVWKLSLKEPPPIEQVAGVQARLNQLGFDAGEVTGQMNDQTTAAIVELQHQLGHPTANGVMDDDTRNAILAMLEGHDQ
jgi:hypothetical protein